MDNATTKTETNSNDCNVCGCNEEDYCWSGMMHSPKHGGTICDICFEEAEDDLD
jgi:hypothetical protein